MTTAVFDTLKVNQDLKAAGFDEAQAGAIVRSMAEAFDDTVATKADIVAVRSDIEKLELATKADIIEVKNDIDKLAAATKADILATKADITEVKNDIDKLAAATKADIISLESRMEARFARMEATMWKAGISLAGAVVILNKLLDWLIQ